jgi:2,3-dihydroxybiphenyl 1,2-dioxygenase
MSSVRALAYIGVRGADLDEWRSFAQDVLGASVSDGANGSLRLRIDQRAHRLTVEQGEPGLAYLGFEVATPRELTELIERLRADGVEVVEDAGLAAERDVRLLARCHDPAGNVVELVVGHRIDQTPFASPTGVQFVTEGEGFGHAFMFVPSFEEAWHFYVDVLGMKLSDTIAIGPGVAYFLHCNARHHSLAIGEVPGMNALLHIMLEVDSLQAVGRALDVVTERRLPITMSLGMHTNDEMVSFYVKSPSGFDVEYGCHGRKVDDDDWTVGHYSAISYWGHRPAEPMTTSN